MGHHPQAFVHAACKLRVDRRLGLGSRFSAVLPIYYITDKLLAKTGV